MNYMQRPIIQTQPLPMQGWCMQRVPWVTSGFVCVGYLSRIVTTRPLSLLSVLLLTEMYGAWLLIYWLPISQIRQRRFEVRVHPFWLLALFCLACASQCIPLPATNV